MDNIWTNLLGYWPLCRNISQTFEQQWQLNEKTMKLLVYIAYKMIDARKNEKYFGRSLKCLDLPILSKILIEFGNEQASATFLQSMKIDKLMNYLLT
jgi:hypothetical protein